MVDGCPSARHEPRGSRTDYAVVDAKRRRRTTSRSARSDQRHLLDLEQLRWYL